MAEASNGDIYLGTSTKGLAIFKKASSTVELVNVRFPSKRLQFLSFLSEHLLLISSEDRGAYVFNTDTKKIVPIIPKQLAANNWIINDAEQFSASVYLLSTNHGLWLYDYQSNNVIPFLTQIEKDFGIIEISDVLLTSTSEFFVAKQRLVNSKKTKDDFKQVTDNSYAFFDFSSKNVFQLIQPNKSKKIIDDIVNAMKKYVLLSKKQKN